MWGGGERRWPYFVAKRREEVVRYESELGQAVHRGHKTAALTSKFFSHTNATLLRMSNLSVGAGGSDECFKEQDD